jgi:cell volume regulation protein A
MIELAMHDDASFLVVVREFAVEMAVGVAAGLVGVALLVPLMRRVRFTSVALYPVFALVAVAALYGATSLAHGSGFLAVFITGLVLGNVEVPSRDVVHGFHSSLANLAELAVFVSLGLTISLGGIPARTWAEGVAIALALAFVIRPLAVFATIPNAGFTRAELLFITWSGLKGAVPILLAAFAVLAGAPGAEHVYELVFVVVLVSVLGQGTLVPAVARRLAIPMTGAGR